MYRTKCHLGMEPVELTDGAGCRDRFYRTIRAVFTTRQLVERVISMFPGAYTVQKAVGKQMSTWFVQDVHSAANCNTFPGFRWWVCF